MRINLREVVIAILIFVLVFAVVQISVGSYRVEKTSMDPTFKPKDCVMVDKLTYRFRAPHRGEVVILWPPTGSTNPFIKRVVGLPGETVKIQGGRLYIAKKGTDEFLPLSEDMPGVSETPKCKIDGTWEIPKGQYFVLGDNRDASQDSTEFGPVKRSKLIGKTWLRYWPLSRFGLTPHYSYELVEITTQPDSTGLGAVPALESLGLAVSTN